MAVAEQVRGTSVPWHTRGSGLPYLPALDGLRAIAVAAVVLFHASVRWLPGGFLGVDLFFVLSGFLITSILLHELGQTRRLDFVRFYLGRARRLLPALAAVLLVSAVLALVLAPDAVARLREDIVASGFYVTNWWNIIRDQSYFDLVGRPPLLQHLWSLAIEEQFYLIWPTVLLFVFRWRGLRAVRRVAIGGAAGSALLMLVLSVALDMPGGSDPSRLYFGSDTHAMGILAGAALATVWRPSRLPRRVPVPAVLVLTLTGALALASTVWAFHVTDEHSAWPYRGGFLAFSLVCVALIAVVTHPAVGAARLLAIAPLRYLGTRSYGIYLWHWPVFMVTRPGTDIGWQGTPALIFRLILVLVIAELSYRFIEMPVRNGALARTWRRWRAEGGAVATRRAAAVIGAGALSVTAIGMGLASARAVDASTYLHGATSVGGDSLERPASQAVSPQPDPGALAAPAPPGTYDPHATGTGPIDYTKRPVTAIGDSVMLGARYSLDNVVKKLTVDAAVSRQSQSIFQRARDRKAAGQLADVVILHPGTNGPALLDDLTRALRDLSDRERVVLVTDRMPDTWMSESNSNIEKAATRFANVRIADWAAVSDGRREYFVFDGTHTTESGSKAYARVIGDALRAP